MTGASRYDFRLSSVRLSVAHVPSPLGDVALASERGALVACALAGQRAHRELVECGTERPDEPVLRQAVAWLGAYLAGHEPSVPMPELRPQGTAFQHEVWRLIREVPYGSVTTYGELANLVVLGRGGGRMSAQAVGGAVGKNPLAIFVPCHRVLAAGGRLGGYGGGLDKKLWLLAHEGINVSGMALPTSGRFAGGGDALAR